ncbi:MAG: hypothetical protein KDA42_11435 [Planctomycetales bacterium]|nr:hypothetical protein [Planctomycetales bacterium]
MMPPARHSIGRLVCIGGVLVVVAPDGKQVHAAVGGQITMPPPGTKPKSGLRLTLDAQWVASEGYRPIVASVVAAKPSPLERELTIELECRSWWGSGGGVRVEQDLLLPAGATSAQTIISTPWFGDWNHVTSSVLVNGWPVKELSSTSVPVGAFGGQVGVGPVSTLIVGSGNQSAASFAALGGGLLAANVVQAQAANIAANGNPATTTLANLFAGQTNVVNRPTSNLSSRWIDYSGLDLVYVSQAEFAGLVASPAWPALLDWTATGGNLAFEAPGGDATWIRQLDAALGRESSTSTDGAPPWRLSQSGIEVPIFDPSNQTWQNAIGLVPGANAQIAAMQQAAQQLADSAVSDALTDSQYLWRQHGLGYVYLFELGGIAQADEEFYVNSQPGTDPNNERFTWQKRLGFTAAAGSEAFWWHLIPGVGLPPVTMFCILITGFAVVIGPVNYFFLRRRGRLYLLLLTVPASAAVATLLLIGYAIASDGLSSRVRVRSYTLLDQRNDKAVCWAWLSYYCSLSPGDGLAFPADVAVFPFPSQSRGFAVWGRGREWIRDLQWTDHQRMSYGWLAARTPTQYVTARSRASQAEISFDYPAAPRQAHNRLGVPIGLLVLRDRDGNYFVAEAIDHNAKFPLQEAAPLGALSMLAQRFEAATPRAPAQVSAPNYGAYQTNQVGWACEFEGGMLESTLQAICKPGAPQAAQLEPRSYVAIVAASPEVELGIDGAEESSFHVVQGRW